MVLLVAYAAGLRLSEARYLKIPDIDSQRMQLRVTCGKGCKERRVPMSPRLLTALRDYWRERRPPTYLFPGKTTEMPLSATTVQKACKAAAREAKLSPNISPHTLRHSFATSLLEAGVDLLTISQLLGHKSFTTTMIYLHVRRPHLNSTPSPIDWLPVRQCPRKLQCISCDHQCHVYNSCGDRHCPQCGGAKRADWLDKTAELLLPEVNYFQVVFTLPDLLSAVALGNRRAIYALLMRAAWRALQEVLQQEQGIEPAAVMVLHTWNQELDHHAHVHALVPGGGPSLDGKRWITTSHPKHRRHTKPYLVDNRLLGEKFREHFTRRLKRLHAQGVVMFEPPILPGSVTEGGDEPDFAEWVDRLGDAFNVFIEAPPENSPPQQMLKYLTRYLTGGPISDGRLISHEQGPNDEGEVTFWARSKNKQTGNQPREFSLPGAEFVRRRPTCGRCPHAHLTERLYQDTPLRRFQLPSSPSVSAALPSVITDRRAGTGTTGRTIP